MPLGNTSKLTYSQAQKLSLKVEWKVGNCLQKHCWCRPIHTKEKIEDENGEEIRIIGSGTISTELAEHIVKLHNASLKIIKN